MEQNKYICECGKVFITPNSFNGHKSHCKVHYEYLGKTYNPSSKNHEAHLKGGQTLKQKNLNNKQLELNLWISEKHTCEKCGKVMTEKFGSGRFCSRACANSRNHSEETKQKISSSASSFNAQHPNYFKHKTKKHETRYCSCCKKEISSYNKTGFCNVCLKTTQEGKQKLSEINKNSGGYRIGAGIGKHGWYKGYWCDSSWELAFVIYNIDHNISFKRNTKSFIYVYNNEIHKYIPDFIIADTYIEIKGYWSEQWQAKVDQFKENLKILTKTEIQPYLTYVIDKYGSDFTRLYDK